MYTAVKRKPKNRRIINIHQGSKGGFKKGYISTLAASRRPQDSLSDLTNMEIVQDGVPRPRPPLVEYGTQPALPVIGRGEYRYDNERWILWMLDDSGTGKVYKQKDGGTITLIGGSYDDEAWAGFCQSKGRVYIYNGVDPLTYLDLATGNLVTYTAIDTPTNVAANETSLTGSTFTYYYRVTANNEVGETAASSAVSETVALIRDAWGTGDFITVTWDTVTGADSYTVYMGDSPTTINELATVTGLTYVDDGTLAVNPFKTAPEGNSTEGPIPVWMYNDARVSQVFAVDADNKLWYAAPGTGDFSPYNGGGYVTIDEDGASELNYVTGFRDGKGNPAITVSSRGAAGKGKLHHAVFNNLTYGDQVIVYLEVFEANGQSGTYSARGTIKHGDSIAYPTGEDFKSTGTSQNIVNIITTNSISQAITPDVNQISLDSLHKSVGLEYQGQLFWALPVGSDENNQIWYMDSSRKNLWVLRWLVAAKDLWLYEDNDGQTHFCALVDNKVLEFSRRGGQTTQDDGVPFKTRTAFSSLTWDEDGITLANIYRQYFKFLQPRGEITVNAIGLKKNGLSDIADTDSFTTQVSFTGIGAWDYSGDYMYGDDVGILQTFSQAVSVLTLKPKGLLNQLDWEVVTEGQNCDYLLSTVNTRGKGNDNLVYSN